MPYAFDLNQPIGNTAGTLFLYARYSSPNIFSRHISSFLTNMRNMKYITGGVVKPIQEFTKSIIPGTMKTTQAAYKGWRHIPKIPPVTRLLALNARVTVTMATILNGIPIRISKIPTVANNQYGIKFISNRDSKCLLNIIMKRP